MSILPGEGSHVILYGSTTFAVRTRAHSGYLARPDVAGSFPVAVVLGTTGSGVKELCRQLARRGVAAVAIAGEPAAGAVADLMKWISAPGTPWADAARVGVIVTGSGGIDSAARSAARSIVLLDAGHPIDAGGRPTLGLYGSDGDATPDARRQAAAIPGSQWVFYADATGGFWDLGADGYRPDAAADTVRRIVAFLAETLSAPEAA